MKKNHTICTRQCIHNIHKINPTQNTISLTASYKALIIITQSTANYKQKEAIQPLNNTTLNNTITVESYTQHSTVLKPTITSTVHRSYSNTTHTSLHIPNTL